MKMVFKVVGNFDDSNFYRMLDKLEEKFSFIYYSDAIFASIKNYKDSEQAEDFLKKIFRPARNFLIAEINETNINRQSDIVKEWCLNNFVKLESQKFEDEEQTRLKQVWERMDHLEQTLNEMQNELRKENN